MEDSLIELAGLIYDAAIDPRCWESALESVADFLRADSTALQVQSEQSGFTLSVAGKFPVETLNEYAEHFVWSDPRFRAVLARGPGHVATSEMLVPMSEYRKTEVYADFFDKWDLPFVVGGLLFHEPGRMGMLVANRSRRHGDFDTAELRRLQLLFPHFSRAVEIQSRLVRVATEKEAVVEAFDRWPMGVILVDEKAQVIEVNRQAREIIVRGDGLSIQGKTLSAARSEESRELRRLVRDAASVTFRKGHCPAGAMRLSRPSLKQSLSILIAPLHSSRLGLNGQCPAALVIVTDPDERAKCGSELLCKLFGLTRAEARLAAFLVQGVCLKEAAARLEVSYETVRNQVKSIFLKTGTSSQTTLVLLLLRSPAALVSDCCEPAEP